MNNTKNEYATKYAAKKIFHHPAPRGLLFFAIAILASSCSTTMPTPTPSPTRMIIPLSSAPSMQLALSNQLDRDLAGIVNDPAKPLASLSVIAVRQDGVVYQRQFGYKFIDRANPEKNKKADVETLYRVASISKMITTLGVMKLVEEGKLNLDRDISDYLGYKYFYGFVPVYNNWCDRYKRQRNHQLVTSRNVSGFGD